DLLHSLQPSQHSVPVLRGVGCECGGVTPQFREYLAGLPFHSQQEIHSRDFAAVDPDRNRPVVSPLRRSGRYGCDEACASRLAGPRQFFSFGSTSRPSFETRALTTVPRASGTGPSALTHI